MTAITLRAQTFTTVYSFCAQAECQDGELPVAGRVQATNGDLYGTTEAGGVHGAGTVFKITLGGALTKLYSFGSQSGWADGAAPFAELAQNVNGDFYGTTASGGANGYGTVFKITPSGTLTTLYSFCSQSACGDGANPYAGVALAGNGDFYGTTYTGGPSGGGTVFRITPGGTLTTLYGFCSQSGCVDGSAPRGTLLQAANGDLYGTTNYGGAYFRGTVFKITSGGMLRTLYSFGSGTNGEHPDAGLVQATSGDFWGTTFLWRGLQPRWHGLQDHAGQRSHRVAR